MTKTGRSGYADYADLLRMVIDAPGTTADLADRFGISAGKMRPTMAAMCGAGLVLVRRWENAPVWAFDGSGCPLLSITETDGRGLHVARFCRLMVALMQAPQKLDSLRATSGIDADVLRELMRHLCTRARLAYVAHWSRSKRRGGPWLAHYSFGIDKASQPHPRHRKAHDLTQLLFTTAGRQWPPHTTTERTTCNNSNP